MVSNSNGGDGAGRALNGRYQLINLIGGGGMAQVYRARDNVLGRTVAVKVLREQYVNDAQFVARFRREAQAAANLAHPNIVNVYDVGQDGDFHYIVMEYIAGENLKEVIRRSAPLPTDKAVSIAISILAGLEYAHRSGLIHRDVKSQNVLISPEGAVKVTDFGIAKSVSDLGLTEAGMALGTAHYFSPEQAKGERVVPQSDIYAVGVTLYEMLTGQLPFESENVMGLAYKHISEPPRPVRQLNASVPARLEAIVMKALAKSPNQRFGSAVEMEKALRAVQSGGQQPTVEVPVSSSSSARGGRSAVPAATSRVGSRSVAGGPTTGSLRTGSLGRGTYPAAGGAIAVTRHMTSPLGAPASVAIRPAPAGTKSGGIGCSAVAVTLLVIGLLGVLLAAGLFLAPRLSGFFTDSVIPSPTPTPVIPTATPTSTPVPPTNTPTSTPTNTSTPTPTPPSVAVPQLVGLGIQDAVVLAKQRGFMVVELERIDTPEWGAGIVAQQNPQPNSILKQTSAISVRVSKGPPPFKLPQLSNTDPADAKATLESAGLKVQTAFEGSVSIPKGVVIRSEPQADASVRSGDTVTLVVSRGEVVEVPDLRGVENIDIVQERLDALGLTLGNVTEEDDPTGAVPPGAVLNQDPPKGRLVEKGTPIDIKLRRRE